MPLLADPGHELMQAVLERDIDVVVVPGPTALVAALSVSGIAPVPFTFLGYSPRKSTARRTLLSAYAHDARTLVLYESPKRLLDTLRDAQAVLSDRPVAVACELTKLYEETWRGDIAGAISHFEANAPRGEYVVVIQGAETRENDQAD